MDINFQFLVDEYYQALFRFGRSLSKNDEQAADLTQQTFLIWAQKGDTLRDKSKVKTWLFTTLYREFLKQTRRSSRQVIQEDSDDFDRVLPVVDSEVMLRLDARDAMYALDRISENYRVPLSLFYLDDLSYKEISTLMELPIGTVMSRLSRGKIQLRELLSEEKLVAEA